MLESPVVRIPAPTPVSEPPRTGFPLVATLAPIVVSAVLFAVTRSPIMLLMAALGPVIAVATFADGRRQRRRARRRERERFLAELAATEGSVRAATEAERQRRRGWTRLDPAWGADPSDVALAVARGDVPSGVELAGSARADDDPRLVALRRDAGVLADAPVLRQAAGSFAVGGPAVVAAAVARTLALRLAARWSPAEAILEAPGDELWAQLLPHPVSVGAADTYRWRVGDREVVISWGRPAEPGAEAVDAAAADATTRATARRAAATLRDAAALAGLRAPGGGLPEAVALASLLDPRLPTSPGLTAPLGVGPDGPFLLDLVADGPHAIVAGTTGSGKSELLVSWVLGMAAGRSPAEVSFVLVDFKGGAAFAPLARLPHVLGTLSDLDERLARRAIESLRAEVLRRERVIAAAGVRSIAELSDGALARLVVVVDEFAALLAERADLHALFADLAARGRSLGIHLVLCTQRPAGVVRDAVLANIAVRIGLRVADRGDGLGLLGDDAAARLPALPKGRAVVVDGSGGRQVVQVALADASDVARLAVATPPAEVPRPWCDPLPPVVAHETLPPAGEEGIPFGLLDLTAVLGPRDGHLLVLGAPGAGTTTALAALAAGSGGAAYWLPSDPIGLWAVLADPGTLPRGALLLADDLDLTLARCGSDHAVELADLVGRLLRDGPARGLRVAASARRIGPPVHALAPLFGSRLLLRLGGRDEHVLAGGDAARFDPGAVPGSGVWRGAVVQVARPATTERRVVPVPDPVVVSPGDRELAIVAARPRDLLERWPRDLVRVRLLGEPAPPPEDLSIGVGGVVILGDPDAWQAEWAELARARRELPLVVAGCSVADVRALARPREVPPPLGEGEVWLVEHGRVRRAVLSADAGVERGNPRKPSIPSQNPVGTAENVKSV